MYVEAPRNSSLCPIRGANNCAPRRRCPLAKTLFPHVVFDGRPEAYHLQAPCRHDHVVMTASGRQARRPTGSSDGHRRHVIRARICVQPCSMASSATAHTDTMPSASTAPVI
eukprot:366256-Chlamydomonas_euryale.AAC.4